MSYTYTMPSGVVCHTGASSKQEADILRTKFQDRGILVRVEQEQRRRPPPRW